MRKPENPCSKCTSRSAECHANCKYYKWYQAEQEMYRDFMHKQKDGKWIEHTATRDRRNKNGN